jgi:AraC family transcriptional regulator
MNLPQKCLYGDVVLNALIAGLTLTETSYTSNLTLPKHSHEHSYFCLVLEGNFSEQYGKRLRACRPSTLIYHPSGETHSDRFYTGARCFNIHMNAQWVERLREYSCFLDSPADFQGGSLAHIGKRLYNEFRNLDNFSSLVIEGLALELIAESSRRAVKVIGQAPSRWLKDVRELLHARFLEPLTLNNIADAVGIHPAHLSREFRRHYRCTVGEYVRKLRIDYACQRLLSDDALSTIASDAGFFDQSHFARTFKLLIGTTPNRYRNALHSRKCDAN